MANRFKAADQGSRFLGGVTTAVAGDGVAMKRRPVPVDQTLCATHPASSKQSDLTLSFLQQLLLCGVARRTAARTPSPPLVAGSELLLQCELIAGGLPHDRLAKCSEMIRRMSSRSSLSMSRSAASPDGHAASHLATDRG
ncbi:MAG UNVERIFIED_CONTAM: hypothetical protein LVR18_25435 [Planctomycetaceae bacterium]